MIDRLQLIGAEASYYTGKVRAYLRWKGLPFDEVPATAQVYREVILPRTGVAFIPVVLTAEGEALQDSTAIIDALEARVPEPSVYPRGPIQRLVALLLEIYADEWLVLPAMHYRWSFAENREFLMQEFGGTLHPEASVDGRRTHGERASEMSEPPRGVGPQRRSACHTIVTIRAHAAFSRRIFS